MEVLMENENVQNIPEKRKYAKDNPASVKKRNDARKEKPKSFDGKINFCCETAEEKDRFYNMATQIKTSLGGGNPNLVTNKDMLNEVFSFYLKNITNPEILEDIPEQQVNITFSDTSFTKCSDKEDANQSLFIASTSAVDHLIQRVTNHGIICKSLLKVKSCKLLGHVAYCKLMCEKKHEIAWSSTPYIGDKYLGNLRMAHGYYVSGILPNQYQKFCQAAAVGSIGEANLSSIFAVYSNVVSNLVSESYEDALMEEIVSYNDMAGINILTDARHGTRKNSMFTDVVCIGANTHKVLRSELVSKADCPYTQKHELMGTERIYNYFDSVDNGIGVHIKIHCHDRNTSVNKFIFDRNKGTVSTNDTWHATKNLSKEIKKVCSGPKYLEGKTWHPELSDKAGSVKTHVYWAMKNCTQDPEKLKFNILNITQHYKNNHEHCHDSSRCKTDPNYISSKLEISDPKAEGLLGRALMNTQIYKTPCDYIYCMDTYYVESFNNALLQYHDKRINFSKEMYALRTNLAILDWNEHVNRPITSEKNILDARNPRRISNIKIRKRKSYNMWKEIWEKFVDLCITPIEN